MKLKGGNPRGKSADSSRFINIKKIYLLFCRKPSLTHTQICTETGYSLRQVQKIIKELKDNKLVDIAGKDGKEISYSFNHDNYKKLANKSLKNGWIERKHYKKVMRMTGEAYTKESINLCEEEKEKGVSTTPLEEFRKQTEKDSAVSPYKLPAGSSRRAKQALNKIVKSLQDHPK